MDNSKRPSSKDELQNVKKITSANCKLSVAKIRSSFHQFLPVAVSLGFPVDLNPKLEPPITRSVGFFGCVSFILGTIVGSGIFISPGGIIGNVGNVWISLIVWGVGGFVACLGAIVFIELSTVVPTSGGEYSYILEAYGSIPAFLTVWSFLMLVRPSMIAILFMTCAQNILDPISDHMDVSKESLYYETAIKVLTIFLLFFFSLINCISSTITSKLNVIVTAAKLLGLFVIICTGVYYLSTGHTQNLKSDITTGTNYYKIPNALFNGLWAYDGWDQLNFITEEIVDPYKNLPRAIMFSIPAITVVYILVNVAYLTKVDPAEFATEQVALLYGKRALGVMSFLMPISVVLSTAGAGMSTMFTTARVYYVAARNGHMPDIISFVHYKSGTPIPSLILSTIITTIMIVSLRVPALIDFFSYCIWIIYCAAIISQIVLRYRKPFAPRPFKVPFVITFLAALACTFVMFGPVILDPKWEYLLSVLFTLGGLVFYFPFVYFRLHLPGMGHITRAMQILLHVVPPPNLPQEAIEPGGADEPLVLAAAAGEEDIPSANKSPSIEILKARRAGTMEYTSIEELKVKD